ncbi:MAG: hypothetical protein ACI841_000859 [Planctomycetota bacterium]
MIASILISSSLTLSSVGVGALAALPSVPQSSTRSDDANTGRVEITPAQEEAVARGLRWLADHQSDNGGWAASIGFKLHNSYKATAEGRGHVGVTGLAGMAFLAGGNLPGRGEYGEEVGHALEFVLSCVQDDGYITYAGTRMYSHAFATLFLAEIYGMTHREDVRIKLQRAVDFIVASQNGQGGWRYVPLATESDMSIVVCQVLALRAARNIGIRVPADTIDRAIRYVVGSAVTEGQPSRIRGLPLSGDNPIGTFLYQPEGHSRSSFPLTAAGVTALHGLGVYSNELISKGVEYLHQNLKSFNHQWGRQGHYFFWYGHYYGVQAMYTQGGRDWEKYFTEVRAELLRLQFSDGSWPNSYGPGAAFSTATAVLILEIPYCFLPIFQR